ncbi:hypothetical protein COBT_004214, partial [Conglomerata obtusa]
VKNIKYEIHAKLYRQLNHFELSEIFNKNERKISRLRRRCEKYFSKHPLPEIKPLSSKSIEPDES